MVKYRWYDSSKNQMIYSDKMGLNEFFNYVFPKEKGAPIHIPVDYPLAEQSESSSTTFMVRSLTFAEDNYIMKFTGLCDKNGTLIYEGDHILKGGNDYIGYVVYGNDRFILADKKYFSEVRFLPRKYVELEAVVIGNIYENNEI